MFFGPLSRFFRIFTLPTVPYLVPVVFSRPFFFSSSLPNHWLSGLFLAPVQLRISLIFAEVGGQRASVGRYVEPHIDGDPFPETPTFLAFSRSLNIGWGAQHVLQRTAPLSLLCVWMDLWSDWFLRSIPSTTAPATSQAGCTAKNIGGPTTSLRFLPDLPWWIASIRFAEGHEMGGVTKDSEHRITKMQTCGSHFLRMPSIVMAWFDGPR